MAVKSTVNAMEERLSVSMLRMKFGDTQQMKMTKSGSIRVFMMWRMRSIFDSLSENSSPSCSVF